MKIDRKKLTLLAVIAAAAALLLLLQQAGVVLPAADVPAGASSQISLPSGSETGWEEAPAPSAAADENAAEELFVYYLDVGQGDSQLVRVPREDGFWNMLIDTGEYAYADGLTDALRSLGVETVDVLVCTHQHTDHMGCMARIVQRFDVGSFYMPRIPDDQVPTTSAYEALLRRLDEKGLTAEPLHADMEIPCPSGAKIQVLAPDPNAVWDGLNNYSGVLRLTWGGNVFLFTGDAEKESEQVMLYSGAELSADVLKLGHHGSSTSTSDGFLQAVDPTCAVISCGKDNPYGHPHRETRAKLQENNIKTYRTDEDGTILAVSDGKNISFTTGLPSIAEKQW